MGFFSSKETKIKQGIKEFTFDTLRKFDAVVTRTKFEKFLNTSDGSNVIYAFLFGIGVFTWSTREARIQYEHYLKIFETIDQALFETGIDIKHLLELSNNYDEISKVFEDIMLNSMGVQWSIEKEKELLTKPNPDYQIIGSHYAKAYSVNDMELAKVYFVKIVNDIENSIS